MDAKRLFARMRPAFASVRRGMPGEAALVEGRQAGEGPLLRPSSRRFASSRATCKELRG